MRMMTAGTKATILTCCVLSFYLVGGTDFLMTSPNPDFHIQAVSGSHRGLYSITYPGQPSLESLLPPWSSDSINVDTSMAVVSGTENKSFIVSVTDSSSMRVYGRDAYDTYTPLPISALGQHYVFSNCHGSVNTTTVLIIATHGHNTTVDITFKVQTNITISGVTYNKEEVLRLNLAEYQTFTLNSDADLRGTRIISEYPIAVYAGTRSNGIISTYDQLLPVKHLGQDYVIPQSENANQNTVIFTSVFNGTSIDINGGLSLSFTGSLSLGGFYSDDAMIVNASKPVLLTLCRGGEVSSRGFCVVPPMSLLPRGTVLPLEGESLKVVSQGNTSDVLATTPGGMMSVQWRMVHNSNYSIGTLNTSFIPSSSFSVTSMGGLAVYVFSEAHLYTGGYHFPFEDAALTSTAQSLVDTTSSISVTDTTSISSAGRTSPISSADTTTTISSADTTTPIPSADTTTTISSADTTAPIPSADTTTPISSADTTTTISVTDISRKLLTSSSKDNVLVFQPRVFRNLPEMKHQRSSRSVYRADNRTRSFQIDKQPPRMPCGECGLQHEDRISQPTYSGVWDSEFWKEKL